MYTSEDDVRRALAKELGRPVRADIWARFVRLGQIQEVLEAPGVEQPEWVADLVKEYRELDSDFPQGTAKKLRENREVPPDRRLEVLSDILAIEAAQLPEVDSFRREVLGGRLLTLEQAAKWIQEKEAEEWPPTWWVKIPLPHGVKSRDWFAALAGLSPEERTRLPVHSELEVLAYIDPQEEIVQRARVRWDGVLGRLKRIVRALCQRYTVWREADAVAFVLCGLVPRFPKARIRLESCLYGPDRINLSLDPRLSKKEVAGIYAKVRPELFKGRDKPMSEKHLALALFGARTRTGETWLSRMRWWNQEYPEWAYWDWRAFARDVQSAWRRVTGRKWAMPTKEVGSPRTP